MLVLIGRRRPKRQCLWLVVTWRARWCRWASPRRWTSLGCGAPPCHCRRWASYCLAVSWDYNVGNWIVYQEYLYYFNLLTCVKGEGWKARDRLIWRAAPCPPCRDHCSRGSCRRTWRWRQWRRWGGCRTVRSWRPPLRSASPWTRAPPPAAPRTATHSLSGRCKMFADQVWQLSTVFGRVSSYGQLWSASRFRF